jgi:hypothetical protein
MVVVWCLLPISATARPRGWPPLHPLPMWSSGNGLLKRRLHEFVVTDVKPSLLQQLKLSVTGSQSPLPINALSVTGPLSPLLIAAVLAIIFSVRYR